MRTSRHAVAAAAVLALFAGACSNEADNNPVGQGVIETDTTPDSTQAPTEGDTGLGGGLGTEPSTSAPTATSTGPTAAPTAAFPTEPNPALGSSEGEHQGDLADDGEAELFLDVSGVDRTNPEKVVAAMVCAYYSSDGTETADEIVQRVAPLATEETVGALNQIRMTAFPGQVRLVAPLVTRQVGDTMMYEQSCHVEVRNAETYEITRSPSSYRVMVGLDEQSDGKFLVSSFNIQQ